MRQEGRIVGEHRRAFGRGHMVFDPWHDVPVLAQRCAVQGVAAARLEGQVLAALGTRLMDPALPQAFAEAFIDEWNPHAGAETAAGAGKQAELAQVERKISNLVDALADGASRGGAVAAKLMELEVRREELRQEVEAALARRPQLHPDLGRMVPGPCRMAAVGN